MSTAVLLVVLVAALAHAIQNCALRASPDPLAASLMLPIAAGALTLPLLFHLGIPPEITWPWLATSALLNLVYWVALGRAYAAAEVGLVFPLARGLIPLLVLPGAIAILGEVPTAEEAVVIAVVISGLVLVVATHDAWRGAGNKRTLTLCLVVAASAAGFMICDGVGVRISGSPLHYVAALYTLNAAVVGLYAGVKQRGRMIAALPGGLPSAFCWGAISLTAYGGVAWAMSQAPLAIVAALRESSVIFAALLATIWLREPLRPARLAGAGLVGLGLVMLRAL